MATCLMTGGISLRFWGNYQIHRDWRIGGVMRYRSGRPLNRFGAHTHPDGELDYGQTYYIQTAGADTREIPTMMSFCSLRVAEPGILPASATLDLNVVYSTQVGNADVEFRLDVFNVLDSQNPTEYFEDAEDGSPR